MTRLAYSTAEAAKALGVGQRTVQRMVRRDEIPNFRIGTKVRIPAKGLAAWVDAQAEPSANGS